MADTIVIRAAKTQEELREMKETQEQYSQTQMVHDGMLRSMKDIQETHGYEIQKIAEKLDQSLMQNQSQFTAMNDRFAAQFSTFEDKIMVVLGKRMDQGTTPSGYSPDTNRSRSGDGIFPRPAPYTIASASTYHPVNPNIDHQSSMRLLKLEVPRFNGDDVDGWVFKAHQYYDYYNTPHDQRMLVSTFHLEGIALHWFRGMKIQRIVRTWEEFCAALKDRFGPTQYEDPLGKLLKLVQQNTPEDYTTQFETLMSKSEDVPEVVLVTAFISGLKAELQTEVKLARPLTITRAFGLAKIFKEKLQELKGTTKSWPERSGFQRQAWNQLPRPVNPGLRALPPPPASRNNTIINRVSGLPVKRLNQVEMQARRDKGLCYNCDERFVPGHRCKPRLFVLVAMDESGGEDDMGELQVDTGQYAALEYQEQPPEISLQSPEISLHALAGQNNPRAMRVQGQIGALQVQVLIDSGSSHNFIQTRIAKYVGLPISASPHFKVQVGNGENLDCAGYCPGVPIYIQGHKFSIDFYVLDVQGADVVLGIQWMQLLGKIENDYRQMTMSFLWKGQEIMIQGNEGPTVKGAHLHQLRRMTATSGISHYFQLMVLEPASSLTYEPPQTPRIIDAILEQFCQVFETPTSLPPSRETNHQIHLEPGSKTVNVRPYRYPHYQKTEIEKIVQEMLETGTIKPSNSPFSSPILLVKKKDATTFELFS